MSDQIDDSDQIDGEYSEAYDVRENVLEAAMPVLAEFFHIVRCPNHSKAERTAAYERACVAWDALEEAYARECVLLAAKLDGDGDGDRSNHGEYGGEGRVGTVVERDADSGKIIHVHPGSRAIN